MDSTYDADLARMALPMTASAATPVLVGGVCGRFAARHEVNPRLVRVAAVALAVSSAGLAGVLYLALWLMTPAVTAHAASEAVAPLPSSARSLYGPVARDLPLVDEMLKSIAQVDNDWLRRMLEHAVSGGGKRMRPAIALLAGRLGDYDLDRLVPLAASVELLHTATLVHDDVIDAAPERRGQPTAAALFNNASSVMLGDLMFAHAAEFVARTGNIRVIRNFAATLGVMAQGELKQDMAAYEYSEDVQRYLDRIYGKTASLFATAAENGAIVSGAPEAYVEPMRRYGEALGMAFQVVDDILDFTGTAAEMGKPVGSDLLAGTLTLPAILYMQRSPDDNPIQKAFEGTRRRANLQRAIEEIRTSDVLDESMASARHFASLATAALEEIPPGEPRDSMSALVEYVLERRT
ncbi:MAG: polyprenyl synthetase family protein [Dehalococcoidia bacterium]|nr:polyprenyl synthetase family protein [Dehalococcoidia bacterium]